MSTSTKTPKPKPYSSLPAEILEQAYSNRKVRLDNNRETTPLDLINEIDETVTPAAPYFSIARRSIQKA